MLILAHALRDVMGQVLAIAFAALALLLTVLILQRLLREAMWRRREQLAAQYGPLVDAAMGDEPDAEALEWLRRAPPRHAPVIAGLLLAPLHVVRGRVADRARLVADDLGLIARWLDDLRSTTWWVRAEAGLALGLVRARTATAALLAALDDDHNQVRAAAVDALGRIGDPAVAPALLARMPDQSRHERARIVEALRSFGAAATAPLVAHAAGHESDRALVAEILSYVGTAEARDLLVSWGSDVTPAVRAAAWRALASVGLDDRTFYHALRALDDESSTVRAMAALALGRSGRADAAEYLASHLDDDWEVAAQGARALARIGPTGVGALRARAGGAAGHGAELAQQLVWEAEQR